MTKYVCMVATEKKYVLNQAVAAQKMRRMALEIIEKNPDESELILVGIRESGSVVARTLQRMIAELTEISTELLTVTLDKRRPEEIVLSKTLDFNDKVIIVIDDVANSGKTLLYALKPFLAFHPRKIQSLVLVERSHHSFPVHSDYVGLSIATTLQDHIFVEVEGDTIMGAYLA